MVIFMEEHRLWMFENGVLREISGAEREFRKLKRTAN
jgi:hypothetical protein